MLKRLPHAPWLLKSSFGFISTKQLYLHLTSKICSPQHFSAATDTSTQISIADVHKILTCDNSRCSHPGSELDHQWVWSLCRGHLHHLGHLLGQLLGSPETGGMKNNMNSNQTPLVHGKSVCEVWKKRTRIFSNDTVTDIQFPQFYTMNPLFGIVWTAKCLN